MQLIPADPRALYNVRLDTFEGPLDLLLHLIRKSEIDIYNIPISEITRQYLEYVNIMKELNLDVAGEFLVMASTLIQIKSRMLLPSLVAEEEGEEEDEDPRAELVRRLLEYQKYKEAGQELDCRELLEREIFARKFESEELKAFQIEEEIVEVGMFELVGAFQRLLARAPKETFHEVESVPLSLAERINEILTLIAGRESVPFDELFADQLTREYIIVTFLAILELCRLKTIRVVQAARFGTIWVSSRIQALDEVEISEGSFAYSQD
ncbi:MAG: segregation/condensation protein A [Geobacter sp.]|nr:segregation/condensation protein A [Geobacter sp.]